MSNHSKCSHCPNSLARRKDSVGSSDKTRCLCHLALTRSWGWKSRLLTLLLDPVQCGCRFFEVTWSYLTRPGSTGNSNQEGLTSLPPEPLAVMLHQGATCTGPSSEVTVVIWCVTACHCPSRPSSFVLLFFRWQLEHPVSHLTDFSSPLGTFALCDGDFSRWGFYSGPRYGVVTAGGDTARNAWPGGGASVRVSMSLLGQWDGEAATGRHPCLVWLWNWHF